LSILIFAPNNPFVARAAAQAFDAAAAAHAGVETSGMVGGAAASGSAVLAAIAPVASAPAPSLRFPDVSAPVPLLTPSPWNVKKPTRLLFPAARPATLPATLRAATPGGGLSGISGVTKLSDVVPGAPTRGPTEDAENVVARFGPRVDSNRDASAETEPASRTGRTENLAHKIAGELSASAASPSDIPAADENSPDVPPYPAGAPRTLAEADLSIPTDRTFTPSPDWHKQVIESLVIDRYERGPGSQPQGDPNDNNSRHGGNLKGIAERLDYLQKKGVTTIMITPVVEGPSKEVLGYYGYHGYWPIHFLAVDPHLGTLQDLQELKREASKRGMHLVLDLVVNHAGPVFDYKNPAPFDDNGKPREIKEWTLPLWPTDLRDPSHFVRRGVIGDWTEKAKELGDFPPNLPKLDMSDPATQDMMIHVAKWWIKEADLDGYRLDTFQHVDPAFWPIFKKDISDYAKKLGKNDFLFIPEIYHGDPNVVAAGLKAADMQAAYNYPAWFSEKDALHGRAPTRQLEDSFVISHDVFGDGVNSLVRFLENQDRPRFLGPSDPAGLLNVAIAHLFYSVGIPLLYHGTEALFRAESDVDNGFFGSKREDMWGHFDPEAPMYKLIAKLAGVRSRHLALQLGKQYVRWSDPAGAGIYAFSRIHEKEEVLFGENTADHPRSATMYVDRTLSPPGTVLTDELDASYSAVVRDDGNGGAVVTLDVPGHGVRLMAPAQGAAK
jgi:glycosidase